MVVTTEKYHSRSEENSTHEYPIDNPFSTPHDQRSIISSGQQYSIFTGMALSTQLSLLARKKQNHPILSILVCYLRVDALFSSLESKPLRQRKFKSARLIGEYDKPWTVKRDPRMLWDKIFFVGLTIVGLGIGAYIIYSGWASVENPPVSLCSRLSLSFPKQFRDST